MKLLKSILLLIITFQFSGIYAQKILYSHSKDEVVASEDNAYKNTENGKQKSKFDYSVNMGTSFGISNFGNAMNLFVEPELRYRLSPKLSISTGFFIINSNVNGLYSDIYSSKNNFTSSYLTASISYNATERLRISGEILYGMNKSPFNYSNGLAKALRFSAEYKISESLRFGIQIMHGNNTFSPFSPVQYGSSFSPIRRNNTTNSFF